MDDEDQILNSFVSGVRVRQKKVAVVLTAISIGCVILGLALLYYSTREVKSHVDKLQRDVVVKEQESVELTKKVEAQGKKLEDSQEALAAEKKALPPVDPSKAGIKAYHQGRYKEAIRSYDEALKKDPNNAYIWDLKGYSLFKAGKYEESIKALRTSVEIDPQYAWGYFDLARVYCKINKHEAAVTAARTAVKLWPGIQTKMRNDREFTGLCGDPSDLLAGKVPEDSRKP